MQTSRKLLISGYRYPAFPRKPSSYTTQQLATVSGANYTTYTITEDGWYRIDVCGGAGGNSSSYQGGRGGASTQDVYLYQGMVCLLWSGSRGMPTSGVKGTCGYPGTQDNTFGGYGAKGHYMTMSGTSMTKIESGASGGGGCCSGITSSGDGSQNFGGGGAGSGFIAGFTDRTMPSQSFTCGSMTLGINRNLTIGSVVTYTCVPTYLVCGGGGGASSTRANAKSGAGGGAFGSGGDVSNAQVVAQAGPAGSWGKGGDGTSGNGNGGNGAWGFIDWSTNTTDYGTGGSLANVEGHSTLYKIIPN